MGILGRAAGVEVEIVGETEGLAEPGVGVGVDLAMGEVGPGRVNGLADVLFVGEVAPTALRSFSSFSSCALRSASLFSLSSRSRLAAAPVSQSRHAPNKP